MMALLTVLAGRKGLLAIVTGPAVFTLAEGFHGQSVACIGAARLFLEQDIVAGTATYSRTFVGIVIERYGSETFGILEDDFSGSAIRLNRRPTPQQTNHNEHRHTENQHPNFHRTPFSNDDTS
jgi:hypothetical protein